uniref:Uncharacterized protein n=1 Tax=Anguilla anguilla TaxID=7936 RepID=A0A0E9RL31_ANGAN
MHTLTNMHTPACMYTFRLLREADRSCSSLAVRFYLLVTSPSTVESAFCS